MSIGPRVAQPALRRRHRTRRDIGRLLDQAKLIDKSTQLNTISILFGKISTMLKNLTPAKASIAVKTLRERQIFPIMKSGTLAGSRTLATSIDTDVWFIADRRYLHESFRGIVALLAFSAENLDGMHTFLEAMELKPRYLSESVECQTSPGGEVSFQNKYTKSLRAKAPFIIS